MSHFLITGGCGFIGTNVVKEAVSRGHEVTILDSLIRKGSEDNARYLEEKFPGKIKIVRGDIRNMEDLQRVSRPDVVINFAANPGVPWSMSWPGYDFAVNTIGVSNLLEFCRFQGNVPFIQASTNKVYSDLVNEIPMEETVARYKWGVSTMENIAPELEKNKIPQIIQNGIDETFPIDAFGKYPHSPYGVSKLAADVMVQEYHFQYGLPAVVNRMSCIYGEHQKGVEDQGWTWWFVYAKKKGIPLNIFGDGKQVRDVLFGSDVARLYVKQAERLISGEMKFGLYNVGGGMKNNVSLIELISFLDENFGGSKLKLNFKDWRPADQKIYISNSSKVEKELNWQQDINWKNGILTIWEEITGLEKKGLL